MAKKKKKKSKKKQRRRRPQMETHTIEIKAPVSFWAKFDQLRTDEGFCTRNAAFLHLMRHVNKNGMPT